MSGRQFAPAGTILSVTIVGGQETRSSRRGRTLTARQRAVLEYIIAYRDRHGFPPTIREIGAAVTITSTNGVVDHLQRLKAKGYIARASNAPRAIVVLRRPDGSPTGYAPVP